MTHFLIMDPNQKSPAFCLVIMNPSNYERAADQKHKSGVGKKTVASLNKTFLNHEICSYSGRFKHLLKLVYMVALFVKTCSLTEAVVQMFWLEPLRFCIPSTEALASLSLICFSGNWLPGFITHL